MDLSIRELPKTGKWVVMDHHFGMVQRTVLADFDSVIEAAKFIERMQKEKIQKSMEVTHEVQ